MGNSPIRGKQLAEAIYRQRGQSCRSRRCPRVSEPSWPNGVTALAALHSQAFPFRDGTIRYLIGLADGESVETVWMPEGDGGEAGDGTEAGEEESGGAKWHRATICMSSQVGCAVNCQFCLTAKLGVKRNLTAGEIAGQVLVVLRDQKVDVEHGASTWFSWEWASHS